MGHKSTIHLCITTISYAPLLSSDRNLNLHTSLNVDNDLLNNLRRRIQINQSLVNAHLVHIPCLGTLTARGLTSGDLEDFGRETNGALNAELLGFGTLEELGADFLEGGDFAAGEGYADFVDFLGVC